jgi:asparagine synthase (glutamine-hydrolysing)
LDRARRTGAARDGRIEVPATGGALSDPPAISGHLAGVYGRTAAGDEDRAARATLAAARTCGERLALGDLALALSDDAPRASGDGDVVCRVAGPLYDVPDLAAALGCDPETPAEVLLARGYRRWGADVLHHVKGEALIVIWDPGARRGLVARDAMGSRALVYHDASGRLSFASELVAMLELLPTRPGPDDAGILLWLSRDATRPDLTPFAGVRQVLPGHHIELQPGGRWTIGRHWSPRYASPLRVDHAEAAELIRPVLLRGVQRRLADDGGTAVMLSGGLDSTAVAGAARQVREDGVSGYSVVFPGQPRLDESYWIDALTEELQLPSVRMSARPEGLVLDALESIARWQAPPLGFDFYGAPLWRKAAADGVTTMLSGDGGDEVFWTRLRLLEDRVRSGRLVDAVRLARRVPGLLDYPPWRPVLRYLRDYGVPDGVRRTRLGARLGGNLAPPSEWLGDDSKQIIVEASDPDAWTRLDGPRWWSDFLYHVSNRIHAIGMPDHLRRSGDAVGIRAGMPLLDQDLVELALRLPPELGFGPLLGKPLLRAATDGMLPEMVRLRAVKTVFNDILIAGVTGPDGPLIRELLLDPKAETRRYMRGNAPAGGLFDDPPTPGTPASWYWAQQVWQLVLFECWLREQADPGFAARTIAAGVPGRDYEFWTAAGASA